MEIIAFSTYPIFLVTGYAWPRYALPVVYKYLSFVLPTTPFMESLVKITQQNAVFANVSFDFAILGAQIIIYYGLLHWRLSYLRKKNKANEESNIEIA